MDVKESGSKFIESEADFEAASRSVIEEIEAWVHALPDGVATLTEWREPGTEVAVEVRPLRAEHAPSVLIYMTWDELEMRVDGHWTSGVESTWGLKIPRVLSPVEALDAVARGRVTRTTCRWKGRVILDVLEVQAHDGSIHHTHHAYSVLGIPTLARMLTRVGAVERDVTNYPPYLQFDHGHSSNSGPAN